ncbi:MAG: hypothetical protein D4R63_10115 [Methylococcaceae bacterium]|nr:MAG: hypothetical protein D4R63_10115 [Methylococcaceae bacterium]
MSKSNKNNLATLLIVNLSILPISLSCNIAFAGLTQNIEEALNFYNKKNDYGLIKFDIMYRYENANQDAGPQQTANGNTASLRLGYLTPLYHDFQAYAEYEGNLAMQEDYNNTLPDGDTRYTKIPDPSRNELNQFWFTYTGLTDNTFKFGRQNIKLDDERFIGNAPWRQMRATYDAIMITNKTQILPNLTTNFGYIANAQMANSLTDNMESPLLNFNYKMGKYGNLVTYGYWLDYTEQANYEKSNQNYGARVACCTKPLDSIKLNDNFGLVYTAEYTHQSNYGHGLTAYDVDRYNVMGGFSAYNLIFEGAMEQLGGTGLNQTFDFPLSSLHAFQGWADLFLQTPSNGIRDIFGTVLVPLQNGDIVFSGMYHTYSDDTGRFNYGDEWDMQVVKKFGKHYSLLTKYAYYGKGDNNLLGGFQSTDTQKIWLQGNINF